MSAYMGFNPESLGYLRDAITRAVDELGQIRCSDPDADGEMSIVRSAETDLGQRWLPLIDAILRCSALQDYRPVELSDRSLIERSHALAVWQTGWQLTTDPVAAAVPQAMTVDDARAVALALNQQHDDEMSDDEMSADDRAWLDERLRIISTRPQLAAAFAAAITPAALTATCNSLGEQRRVAVNNALQVDSTITPDESEGWLEIDAVFASLGAIVSTHNRDIHAMTTEMSAYAAAMLIQHLGLSAAELAVISRTIIEREQVELAHAESVYHGDRAADILMGAILSTAGASTAFAVEVADDPKLLMWSANDPRLAAEVLTVAVDRSTMTAEQAAFVVPALLHFIALNGDTGQYPSYNANIAADAVRVITPYLDEMTAHSSAAFNLSEQDRSAILLLIVNYPGALEQLVVNAMASAKGLAREIAVAQDADGLRNSLSALAATSALVNTMLRTAAILDAEQAQHHLDTMWGFVGEVLGVFTGPASLVVQSEFQRLGIAAGDVDTVRLSSLVQYDVLMATTAAAIVRARFDRAVATGRIASKTTPPPDPESSGVAYSSDFDEWLDEVDLGDEIETELALIKETILSTAQAESSADSIAMGVG